MAPPPEVVPLAAVRADGWLSRLLATEPELATAADVVGTTFVAFAFVAGVRITGLDGELDSPDSTLVDFRVGDEPGEQRLGLSEFRRRLAAALLADEPIATPTPSKGASNEELQRWFGPQLLLLAPVFGLSLEAVLFSRGRPLVRVRRIEPEGRSDVPAPPAQATPDGEGSTAAAEAPRPTGSEDLPLEELRERIRDGIQAEADKARATSAFAIDLAVLPEAERALHAGRPKRAIALLGAWPGPLTMLLRTPQGASLAPEVRVTLSHALGVLGTAYVETRRFDWAEEVLRLGVQFVQEGAAAGDLYRRLGECYAAQARFGEAIGPLRRALALGIEERRLLPGLARAYAARRRFVAAVACAERALALGVDEGAMGEVAREAREALGPAWEKLRDRYPGAHDRASASDRVTPEVPRPPSGPPEGGG